jgi:ABC-type uncharacterized transport system permease subunit
MGAELAISLLRITIASGTSILFVALGEIFAERAGVLNLGAEGMMLVGAVVGFIATVGANNAWIGFAAAMGAGALVGLLHSFTSITLRRNQIISGLVLTIFGAGLSGYLGKPYVGLAPPVVFEPTKIPVLGDVPFIGPILFQQYQPVYLTYLLVPVIWYFIYRTRPGLRLRATGENPGAADAMGINVSAVRHFYTALGGALAGAGGAYLSLAYVPSWLEGMTAGRGWIGIALVIFAGWNPLLAMLGSYLFGGVTALSLRIMATGTSVPPYFLNMLPYALTVLVLILAARGKRGASGPAGLGVAYDREEWVS